MLECAVAARPIRIALAQEERRKLARRTKDGIAAARRNGSKIGRPRLVPVTVERRIVRLHKEGLTLYRIAQHLDRAKTPTPQGGPSWAPSVVRDVITRNTKQVA